MTSLPSTRVFPQDPCPLERQALEAFYLDLRSSYRGLMISRGKHRGQSQKNREAMAVLEQRLRGIAEREASMRAEVYEMLEIVTNVVGNLEDAGDDLVNEFDAYQKGRRTIQGGSFLGNLIKAIATFIRRWIGAKDQFNTILEKQESLKIHLEAGDGSNR